MAIYVGRGAGQSSELPPAGVHDGVCVDVIDRGEVQTNWGMQHKIRIVWELRIQRQDGKPFTVQREYSAFFGDRSWLQKHLTSWRGRPFTPDELEKFDLEKCINCACQLVLIHSPPTPAGVVYANVESVAQADNNRKLRASGHYKRRVPGQQQQRQQPAQQPQRQAPPQQTYQPPVQPPPPPRQAPPPVQQQPAPPPAQQQQPVYDQQSGPDDQGYFNAPPDQSGGNVNDIPF